MSGPVGVYSSSVTPAAAAASARARSSSGVPDPAAPVDAVARRVEHRPVALEHVRRVTLVHREVTLALGSLGFDARAPLGAERQPVDRVAGPLPGAVVREHVPGPECLAHPR